VNAPSFRSVALGQTQPTLRITTPASVPIRRKKRSDLNVGGLTARGKVGLVPHEDLTGLGIAGKKPPIPVGGTPVNLSKLNRHANGPASKYTGRVGTARNPPKWREGGDQKSESTAVTRAFDGTF
jgi:hypothetical protein